jgi:predicted RNA-binding Zn-ribbon protein involved in translation (DUF1610 family)
METAVSRTEVDLKKSYTDVVNAPEKPETPHKKKCPCGGVIYRCTEKSGSSRYMCGKCWTRYFEEMCECGELMRPYKRKSAYRYKCIECGEVKWRCKKNLRFVPCPKCGFVGALWLKKANRLLPNGDRKHDVFCRSCERFTRTCTDYECTTEAEMKVRPPCPRCGKTRPHKDGDKYRCTSCHKRWKREEE